MSSSSLPDTCCNKHKIAIASPGLIELLQRRRSFPLAASAARMARPLRSGQGLTLEQKHVRRHAWTTPRDASVWIVDTLVWGALISGVDRRAQCGCKPVSPTIP